MSIAPHIAALRARALAGGLACLGLAMPALSAPGPLEGGMDGWRFAVCEMQAVCFLENPRCGDMPALGNSYIWRDETGLRMGGNEGSASPVLAFDTPQDALDRLPEAYIGAVLITPPATRGPGWLSVALFETGGAGALSNRFFQLSCETRPEAPPSGPSLPVPQHDRPEVTPDPDLLPELLD